MKQKLLPWLVALTLLCAGLAAQAQTTFVNLTPRPKSMSVKSGQLTLPSQFAISAAGLDAPMTDEVKHFAEALTSVSGYSINVITEAADASALMEVQVLPASSTLKEGGYNLSVTAEKVTVKAKEYLGLYYAFQSLKKMLPANVMAGVKDTKVTAYTLPLVTISDEPRYAYRGFMLDVARNFFTVDEVKRMIDVMAYYKLNRFHWHLSDDQGWRVEIKKYPKLTTVGSIAPNRRFTDMNTCTQYWINKPYGPYFYTQDEIKEVVAYAKARHIEVVPEIDMPGHFVAALAAYPEYSCSPDAAHTVWSDGGISSDVLNVANPQAVTFAKDILNELIDLFPYETIHIGGDECPTSAWEGNALCQQRYKDLGLTNYRQLQSHFIKEMADFVASKGRQIAVWNEAITAGSADVETVQSTGALVYCWTGPEAAATKAKQLGLKNIYTPWGPYYINRKQGNTAQDPPGAGDGTDNVKKTYETVPPTATDYGVQGTFWCEHVSDREYMEWLALPRLLAIAEAAWTPQANKNFADFQKRMTADTTLLNYGGYKYCKYFMLDEGTGGTTPDMVMPKVNTATDKYYYRLVSGGTDAARKDRCIELLSATSPLLTQYAANNVAANRLWTNAQAAETDANYDYQWWSLEEDPANPGKYALVCKAVPGGSVKASPTANANTGRWDYDATTKHYNFALGTGAYGKKGSNYYYTIASDKVSGMYMNSSAAGQGLSVNLWSDPNDGNGGQWEFSPMADYDGGSGTGTPITFTPLEKDKTYAFYNDVDGFDQTSLIDKAATTLQHSTSPFANNAWKVTSATTNADGTQTIRLQNVATGRSIAAAGSFVDRQGFPVNMGSTAADLTLSFDKKEKAFRLQIDGRSCFPLPSGAVNAGATIKDAAYDAPRVQGAEWQVTEVRPVTFTCLDNKGAALGTWVRSVATTTTDITADLCPTFKNTTVESIEKTADNAYTVHYKRVAYTVTLRGVDAHGAIVCEEEANIPVGESFTMKAPTPKYYEWVGSSMTEGTQFTPTADSTIWVEYTTKALTGVKQLADRVTEGLEAGKSYVFYDASPADGGARKGYRKIVESTKRINRANTAEGLSPEGVWTLEATASTNFKVKNDYYDLYVPLLQRSAATTASTTAGSFSFKLNTDGTSWCIKGTNGQMWDGLASGDLVGWDGGTGHPIELYTFYAQPYFTVEIVGEDTEGKELSRTKQLVAAGETFPLVFPTIDGYSIKEVTGNEQYDGTVEDYLTVKVIYASSASGIDAVTMDNNDKLTGIYDLQGRRLQRITHTGLYIVNGKKVFIRR